MQYLIDIIQQPIGKSRVEKLAAITSEETFSIEDLINLSFHKDAQIGFRAAWILENVYSSHQERFLPTTIYFLDHFSNQTNLSALRHFVKILALITKKNASPALKKIVAEYDTNKIVEVVFAWLIDEKIPVAVKSHCLNILANLSTKHGWIKEELIETMDFLVDKESIAFFAKVKQIRKQLKLIK
ncbi:hypothetical protein DHW03_18045 [Pedobacter yonginense]|uniref:HEAT repeat domain-containing protein n=1 Tax=Pedobacter yonginense TaxID=651869 RepID=A0A317EH92_9SPHI|nr:hypothetical protein [Pedobacter yonginense]PWS25954.1 hypothetical protein DHW03_18045 [Pedobacter yonginense]